MALQKFLSDQNWFAPNTFQLRKVFFVSVGLVRVPLAPKWFVPDCAIIQLMREVRTDMLEMVDPIESSDLLNSAAETVGEAELAGDFIQGVIDRMFEIASGKGHSDKDTRQVVGLAAPQIGVSKRIILIDLTANGAKQEQNLIAIVNPIISDKSFKLLDGREGCWSCGNVCGNVQRSQKVTLEGLDRSGKAIHLNLEDFVARIAQHEVDHLDGVRFPDRIPKDQPERLHWVEHEQFNEYREQWKHWQILCPREKWENLKSGQL